MHDDSTRDKRIEPLLRDFEQAWEADRPRAIEDVVEGASDHLRPQLLAGLLELDVRLRIAGGGEPVEEEYCRRFSPHADTVHAVFARLHAAAITSEGSFPARVDRFEIRSELGRGSFGIVYLAYDRHLERLVALKVHRQDRIASADALASAMREAREAVNVAADGIVRILDIRLDHVPPFVVMEYMQGGSLKDVLSQGRLPHERCAELIARVAEALDYARRKQVFHLDLKPANILLDEQGRPNIADFGLAIRHEQRGLHCGVPVGSPAYMSPEQVRGEANKYDGRSDIWSLGVILLEEPHRTDGER